MKHVMIFRHYLSETSSMHTLITLLHLRAQSCCDLSVWNESHQRSALSRDHPVVSIKKEKYFWLVSPFQLTSYILVQDTFFFCCLIVFLLWLNWFYFLWLIPMWCNFYFLFFLQVAVWMDWLWNESNSFIYLLILSCHSGSTASRQVPAEMAFQAAYEG